MRWGKLACFESVVGQRLVLLVAAAADGDDERH